MDYAVDFNNRSSYLIFSLRNVSRNSFVPNYKHVTPDWGPKRDPLFIVIPVTLLYVIIFITGVLGNISTCVVISRNKSMHTATNYYLFSLAISDLLLLVSGLPPEMYSIWSKYPYAFGEAFCVIQGFAAETSANATVLTITAFTVERYVAICHPFLSHTMSKLSRAVKFVIAIWILATCLAIPQAMSFGIIHEKHSGNITDDEFNMCNVKRTVIPHAFGISTCLFFVAPMSLIIALYILIGLQLHRSTVGPSRGNSVRLKHRVKKPTVTYTPTSTKPILIVNNEDVDTKEEGRKNYARNAQATKHVVKMLVAVVVAFFICWAPFHAQRLLAIYGPQTSNMVTAFRILTYVSGILYFLSTSVNPFLYHIMSNKFREAFKETFKVLFRSNRHSKGNKNYSTLSGRSSQINSHSNTDSCSRQSSLRYLEAEMARLHDSKRPLVVSFRRKKTSFPRRVRQVMTLDAELQEALDNLNEQPMRKEMLNEMRSLNDSNSNYKSSLNDKKSGQTPIVSYVEVHTLHPTHVCPLSGRKFKNKRIEKCYSSDKNQFISKSCTMPQIITAKSKRFLETSFENDERKSNSCVQLDIFNVKQGENE